MPTLQEQLQQRDVVLDALKSNLNKAQMCMKAYADSKRRELGFEMGQFVYVKLHPYCQNFVALRKKSKTINDVLWSFQNYTKD